MENSLISVVVLKEGLVNKRDIQKPSLFEESIYLLELKIENKAVSDIVFEIKKQLDLVVNMTYTNECGEKISWRLVKIIDVFDSIYDIKEIIVPNEVYSRHLPSEKGDTYHDIIETFYSDFVWEDEA